LKVEQEDFLNAKEIITKWKEASLEDLDWQNVDN